MRDKSGKNPDAWLEDESIVSRAYGELQQPGPPAHLDERILAEARRAATKPDNVVVRVQHWRKWTMPAALAATVVFAVPLVVRVFTNVPPDFDADRGPSMMMAETMTEKMDEKTAMEIDLVTSDTVLSELASPEARESTNAIVSQQAPQPVTPSSARSLFPDLERTDPEVFPAEEQRRHSEFAVDEPELDTAEGGRIPAPSLADSRKRSAVSADEVFASAPPALETGAAESHYDDTGDSPDAGTVAPALAPRSESSEAVRGLASAASQRTNAARSETTQASGLAIEEADYRPARLGAAAADLEAELGVEDNLPGRVTVLAPEPWLSEIADQHRRGLVRTARRELGRFITNYPDHALPDNYPLQAEDALYDDEAANGAAAIVPEAESWLRGIGLMAERGEIDQARTQLAEFFTIYPDYPLPAGFPLTRDDALPIER